MLQIEDICLHHLPRYAGRAKGKDIGMAVEILAAADIFLGSGQHVSDMAVTFDQQSRVQNRILDREDDVLEFPGRLMRDRRVHGQVIRLCCNAGQHQCEGK